MLFWIVFLLICLLLSIGTLKKPGLGIAGIWCMYGLEQWAQGNQLVFLANSALVNMLVGINASMAFLIILFKGGKPFSNYPLLAVVILFLFAYSFISVQWSPRIDLSYGIWNKFWPYFLILLIISPLLVNNAYDFEYIFSYFVLIGGVLVYMLIFQVDWVDRRIVLTGGMSGFKRYSNDQLGNPLTIAQLGGYVFFATIYIKNNSLKILKLLKWPIAAACLILIVKSGSRGQLIGVFISLMLTWPLVNKISNIKGFISILSLIISIYSVVFWSLDTFWKDSARWKDSEMEHSMGGRFDNAFILLDHWANGGISMLFGLGNSASFDPRIIGIYPHFLPFEILGEEGIIGFGIYILILILIIKLSINVYKRVKGDKVIGRHYAVLLSMVIYSFLISLKQGSLLGNMEFFMAAIILAKFDKLTKNI